jgi:hypothetical protein
MLFIFSLPNCSTEKGSGDVAKNTNYDELVSLFKEFREFSQMDRSEGAPDFSVIAMEKQFREFTVYQNRLKAFDPGGWTVDEQIDFHLVRAEMNGFEFQHRVLKPWVKDPCFYLDQMPSMWRLRRLPLDPESIPGMKERFQAVPALFDQAKNNLSNLAEVPGDLAILALKRLDDYKTSLPEMKTRIGEFHPELAAEFDGVLSALADYRSWIEENQDQMTAMAGVGKENYDWLLKNVYMFPYTWEDCRTIVELEDNRVVTFQKLEENRNRHLPMNKPVTSQEEYKASVADAIDHVMNFLEEEEIFTIHDYLVPGDYFGSWHGFENPWPDHHDYFFNFSHREPVMEETHEMVGHHFDGLRYGLDERPIRGGRRPYKISTGRGEGFAFALEELLMHAGYLDERPRRGREIAYEQAAFRTVRALADVYMHSGDWTLTEAMEFAVANAPHGELLDDSPHLWFEMETTLRGVGHHMIMVVGKVQFMEVFRDRAQQMGDEFVLKDFMDEYLEAGMIPQSLIRWQITGYEDEIKALWQPE